MRHKYTSLKQIKKVYLYHSLYFMYAAAVPTKPGKPPDMKAAQKLLEENLGKLFMQEIPTPHPLNIIDFKWHHHQPFNIIDLSVMKTVNKHVKQAHLDSYYRFIYNYKEGYHVYNRDRYCPLCKTTIAGCSIKHVATQCTRITKWRGNWWTTTHNLLVSKTNELGTTNNIMFNIEVLNTIKEIAGDRLGVTAYARDKLWAILCGANHYQYVPSNTFRHHRFYHSPKFNCSKHHYKKRTQFLTLLPVSYTHLTLPTIA